MANIRKLKEDNGAMFYPLTHEKAVQDSNGVKLDSKLEALASKSYVVSWDGASTPSTGSIPAGVSVTYGGATYTGQLAASSSTIGKIYLVKNGDNYDQYITSQEWSTYSWVPLGPTTMTLDGYATDAELAVVSQKVANVSFVNSDTAEEVIEFQTNGGNFIAKVSPEGLEAKEVKARIGGSSVSLTGVYADASDTTSGSLAIGDANGKDIVQFSDGHVKTKYFDSREAAVGIYNDAGDTNAASLSFGDTNGKNIVIFSEGHIHTKYFDSEQVIDDIEELKQSSASIDDKKQRQLAIKDDYYSYKFGKTADRAWNQRAWYERARILHFSDNHVNLPNLAEAIELKDLVHLVIDTGDNANAAQGASATSPVSDLTAYVTAIGNTPIPLIVSSGNHDVPTMTAEAYYNIMGALMASKNGSNYHFGDASHYRCYGYYDFTPNATIGTIRVINLDPADYPDGSYYTVYGSNENTRYAGFASMNCVFSQSQIDWLIDTLRDAANNGYKVITMMHYGFGDLTINDDYTTSGPFRSDCNFHQDPFMVPDIIDAMQHKTTLSKTYEDDSGSQDIVINEDFSNIGNLHYICHLFGHVHSENHYQCQRSFGTTKMYDMLMLGAPSMGAQGTALNSVPYQPGTINSISLTVLEIDTYTQDIYRVNYGSYKAYDMSNTERTKKIHYRFNL